MAQAIAYLIDATAPGSRELSVRLTAQVPADGELLLFMPTWTPGSYLLREYARHLSRVEAADVGSGASLACEKVSKNRFAVRAAAGTQVEVRYRVYAHELSVRTADLDGSHAYWNHACVLLWPVGQRDAEARIDIDHVAANSLACSLPILAIANPTTDTQRTTLIARGLDEALDAPVLIGDLQRLEWQVNGIDHAIVLEGLANISAPESLASDLERIVHEAASVFGGQLPYPHYTFLAMFSDQAYGGLEHRNSTSLLMARTSLTTDRGYRDFLCLAAHELFHAWNVKRMRPVEFWDYDYENENYTRLLWLMEGWTAYYDDLLVARAGLMTETHYLAAMAKNVQGLLSSPGRRELSLEESSFDAWIRLYRPDENTRNSSQNYYGNGAVAAMCLDLAIRKRTDGKRCLDDVLLQLYRSTFEEGRGYTREDAEQALRTVVDDSIVDELNRLVLGSLEPELAGVLTDVGVRIEFADQGKPFLGIAFKQGSTKVTSITRGSAAFDAGIAPEDELLALRGMRVTSSNWQTMFAAVGKIGEPIDVLLARRGVIQTISVTPTAGVGTVRLAIDNDATERQIAARKAWLGSRHSAS